LATSTFFGNLLVKGTASTTHAIISDSPSALLLTDAAGGVKAYGGASACGAANAVTAISATGGTTCTAFDNFAWPFTPATNYNVNTNSTSTPLWAKLGLM